MLSTARGPAALIVIFGLVGGPACHASPDDAAGQAGELGDPVRRRNAIQNIQRLYSTALEAVEGDRSQASVTAVVDVTIEKLVQAYVDHPEDVGAGEEILAVLEEMRDPRALPAAKKALAWRPGTEQHAVQGARIVRWIEVPASEVAPTAKALGAALAKVRQSRPEDQRLRREAILALGKLADPAAQEYLVKVMERQAEDQPFLFNRLAAQQFAQTASGPTAVPVLLRALFLFDATQPNLQLEDLARSGLVRLGETSVEPLLGVFRGENADVKAKAENFVAAIRSAGIEGFSAERLMKERAAAALGEIGDSRAFSVLEAAAKSGEVEPTVRWEAACALVKFPVADDQKAKVRGILTDVFKASPMEHKPRLIGAMLRTYDPGFLPFLLAQAKDRENHPQLRILAFTSYAQLANKAEIASLRRLVDNEPSGEEGGYRLKFQEYEPLMKLAEECDAAISCWSGKLETESEANQLVKAATMLGRLGRGNAAVVSALVKKLSYPSIDVRVAAIQALDQTATAGSPEAIELLDSLSAKEESTSIGKKFAPHALSVRARLAARAG